MKNLIKFVGKFLRLTFCFLMIISLVQTNVFVKALGSDQTANPDIVRTVALSYKLKGGSSFIDLVDPFVISDSSKIDRLHAVYRFELEDNINPITGETNRTIHGGDFYLIDLPSKVQLISPVNGTILGNDNRPLANFTFIQKADLSWQIKIEFTDYVDDPNEYEIHGLMEFDFLLDLSSVGEGTSTTIYIPIDNENFIEIDVTKPVPPPTAPISLTKTITSYTQSTRELVWNIKMMPDIGKFSGCIFTDTLDITLLDLKSVKHGLLTLVMGTDYTYDAATGKITYLIPNGRDGINYQNIIITAVVKRAVYATLSPTSISNQAQLSGGDAYVDLVSNTVVQTITPNWLNKTGTVVQGNKIQWTLDINANTQSMFNGVITDMLSDQLILEQTSLKLGSTSITVYANSHSPASNSEVYAVIIANPDGTSTLQVFLPRTQALASSTRQTLTFITTVKSPDVINPLDPSYSNSAQLNADLVIDNNAVLTLPAVQTPQVPVSVPHVNLIKGHGTWSAAEKRDGIITWTLAVATNLSNYGTSRIIDTLPSDQDFILDEIYFGSTKIDSTTSPKAVVSADGRTLTIDFDQTNAWTTQQVITVKTKIKQDSYGLNVNRDFLNTAKAIIYSETTGLEVDSMTDTDNIRIQNTVISKTAVVYNGNTTLQGENPRINFSIVVNNNLMPLDNVIVSDDLSKIITEFKKSTDSAFSVIPGLKWKYVANSMKIVKNSGSLDSLDLTAIAGSTSVTNDQLSVNFGNGVAVNDKYTLTFTLELDVSQNEIFQLNGSIRVRGNVGGITAIGLKSGTILTPATGNSAEIRNEILGKTGVHLVAEQQAVWSINLNQHRIGLLNTRVVDILPLGLTLDPTSIKLYTNVIGSNGNFVTGNQVVTQGVEVPFSYTYLPATGVGDEGRFVLTVDLPDNQTSYVLRFATDVSPSLLGKQITNAAYFAGNNGLPENNNNSSLTFSSTAGGGSVTKASVTVYKTNKDNGDPVDGAQFSLYWLRNGDPYDPVFVRTLGTTNGSVIFRGLTRGEIYTITESIAPSGYLLDDSTPVTVIPPLTGTGDATAITFDNTPIKSGTWLPTAIKHLDGRALTETFHFELMSESSLIMTGETTSSRANGDFDVMFSMVNGLDPSGWSTFSSDFIFDDSAAVGTRVLVASRVYEMHEVDDHLPGYTYDDSVIKMILEVYNVKGTESLVMVVKDELGNVLSDTTGNFAPESIPTFSNSYEASGSLTINATKTLMNHVLVKDQFSFELYDGQQLIQTMTNGLGSIVDETHQSGSVIFNPINYSISDIGTKTYTLIEKQDVSSGYTYDPAVFTIIIEINDLGDGTLDCFIQSIQKSVDGVVETVPQIEFNNTYTTSDVQISFVAEKTLTGRILEDNQFSFVLEETDVFGNILSEVERVTNLEHNIQFSNLTYVQSDIGSTKYYQIREINDNAPGYTYDTSVYKIQVEIEDNHDGTIKAVQTKTLDGESVSEIKFNNSYTASGTIKLTAHKTLNGQSISSGQFRFELQPFDLVSQRPFGQIVFIENDQDGSIILPELQFTQSDAGKDYVYVLSEVNTGVAGYIYDKTKYFIMITVNDEGDGTLGLSTTIVVKSESQASITENMTFTNTYDKSLVPVLPNTGENGSSFSTGLSLLVGSILLFIISRKRKGSRISN